MCFHSHINTQSIRINIKIFRSKLSVSSLPFPYLPSQNMSKDKVKLQCGFFAFTEATTKLTLPQIPIRWGGNQYVNPGS